MQKYELVFILKADQPETEMQSRVERTATILAKHQGEITKQDHWGVRRLAYTIEKENKGNYMLLKFNSEGGAIAELDRSFRLDDLCLRHLIVRDEEWEERNRAARAKRRAAKAAAEAPSGEDS